MPEWRYFNYPMTVEEECQKTKAAKIPPLEFKKLLDKNDNIFLLDVRGLDRQTLNTPDLFFTMDNSILAGDYIKGAVHCPLVFLEENYQHIPKNRRILVTDWIMKESIIAAKFLALKGYDVIGILKGGTARWQTEGLPLILGQDSLHRELSCD